MAAATATDATAIAAPTTAGPIAAASDDYTGAFSGSVGTRGSGWSGTSVTISRQSKESLDVRDAAASGAGITVGQHQV